MSNGPRASVIIEELVEALNDLFPALGAKANHAANYTLEDLKTLRCDVFATQMRRPIESRKGRSKEYAIDVLMQQQARTPEAHNELINMADDVLFSVLHQATTGGAPRRFVDGSVLVTDGTLSADELYDGQAQYEDNRFDCRIRFLMIWRP